MSKQYFEIGEQVAVNGAGEFLFNYRRGDSLLVDLIGIDQNERRYNLTVDVRLVQNKQMLKDGTFLGPPRTGLSKPMSQTIAKPETE